MRSVVVTGAAGAVGQKAVCQLLADTNIDQVVALDRVEMAPRSERVVTHRVDLMSHDLAPLIRGASSIVHAAEDGGRRFDRTVAAQKLARVLDSARDGECSHIVLLSSALVYGAHPDNPVPIGESQAERPVSQLDHATIKLSLEQQAQAWAESHGAGVAVLRPTTTLSERGASWIAKALRAAIAVRPEQVDPPLQFLHHDDLAAAVSLAARRRLSGIFNVAPDGWIGVEAFRELSAGTNLHVPQRVDNLYRQATRMAGRRTMPPGIEPYVQHPWVVANDKLRGCGWTPAFSNEEAYVVGTPVPPWMALSPKQRQEAALGAVGVAALGSAAVTALLARRFFR